MTRYKLIIAYEGTDYIGWIQQPGKRSIVQALRDSFTRTFSKEIKLLGASKTDAGVHAMGQTAMVETDLDISPEKLKWVWNNALPSSITIRSLEIAPDFNPHEAVVEKIYHYHFFLDRPEPFYARYGTQFYRQIDLEIFQKTLSLFEGTHNFNAFYTGDDREDTVRIIKQVKLEFLKKYNCYRVKIIGENFLRHMVRRMIGAARAAAQRDSIPIEIVKKALDFGEKKFELPTAPAQGLMLYKIRYGK